MSTTMKILLALYAVGQKLPQLGVIVQPWIDATTTMITELTALFYGRSAATIETADDVRARLTDEESSKLAEVEGLAGRSGIGDWIMKLLALAEKYPALATLLLSLLPKK